MDCFHYHHHHCHDYHSHHFINFCSLGCVQMDATTPNIVAPTMLGVVVCLLAVGCKRMQQLLTMLGPALHRWKDTTHKSL